MNPSTYKETLDYIYGFVDYEKLPGASPRRMNLDRIEALVEALDHLDFSSLLGISMVVLRAAGAVRTKSVFLEH